MPEKTIESDVVIVGSGIGGAMAATALAAKGKRVHILERGIRLDDSLVKNVFESESFIGHPQIPCVTVAFPENQKRNRPLPAVVGGLARFYAGVSLRMREAEFEKWPFPYSTIEPYYSRAEQLMHISGNPGADPLDPKRSQPYPHPLPPMSELSRRLAQGAQALGLKPFQHPMAIHFDGGCVRCNFCNQVPCFYGVKWNPDHFLAGQNKLPIEIFPKTKATRIHFQKRNGAFHIESVETQSARFHAQTFILAAGALGTPLLMLRSGFQEVTPLAGTHLMTHCLGLVVGFFPFQISAENDFHKWWSVSDYYFEPNGEVRGLIQQDHLTTRRKIFAKVPRWLHPLVARFYYNTCQLLVIAEDEPRPENRVEWEGDGERICVRQTFSPKDLQKRDVLARQAKKIMRKAGALMTFGFAGKSVYHACGTCRMGTSPQNSVTDGNGRVWQTDNLYVADGSLFPTSSGVNPSLTIAANALKVADGIL